MSKLSLKSGNIKTFSYSGSQGSCMSDNFDFIIETDEKIVLIELKTRKNAKNKFNQYTNYPAQGLGYLTSALNATPLNNVQNTTTNVTKTPGLFDYLSLGASGYTGGN